MSEFSEKLSYYITQSGYNVYQLAREAALDRTTLQKTVKGQRLPSAEYIKDICSHIKISKKQEEELLHLYQIEKLGPGIVESWDEISQILIDIQRLRTKKQTHNFLKIHFDQESFKSFNEKMVQTFSSETEIVKAIMCMIEEEIMEEDEPEVYMDASWASQYVLSQLVQSDKLDQKPFICHQMVNLRRQEAGKEGVAENYRFLHQVLPYAFVFQKEYDLRYAYVARTAEDNRYYLWPHYIITHRHSFLCSEDPYRAVLVANEEIAKCYRGELEKMIHAYRPLFDYQGMSGEGIRKYRSMEEGCDANIIFEECPCIALMVPREAQELLKNDPAIGKYAEAFFEQPKVNGSQIINIFGMQGIKHFIRTGHLPGVFDQYFSVDEIENRRDMIENFHQHLLNHTRRFYMINEEKFIECGGYGLELYGKNKVVFYSTSVEFPFGFITIDEPGIAEVFFGYFENLLETECVYSEEETIEKYEEIVEEAFREIEEIA